jgi:hypothetical protein
MNPLFADILRQHLALPSEEQPEQRAEEGSSRDLSAERLHIEAQALQDEKLRKEAYPEERNYNVQIAIGPPRLSGETLAQYINRTSDLGGPPWRCPNCHRLNTNERKRCKQCGKERSKEQTPFF